MARMNGSGALKSMLLLIHNGLHALWYDDSNKTSPMKIYKQYIC